MHESPIEELVAYDVSKHLAPGIRLLDQVWVETPLRKFRLDFVIQSEHASIAIECDGELAHQNKYIDLVRDTLIMATGRVGNVYRFRGSDIVHRLHNSLFLLSELEPQFFSHRGQCNLFALADGAVVRRFNQVVEEREVGVGISHVRHWHLEGDTSDNPIVIKSRRHDSDMDFVRNILQEEPGVDFDRLVEKVIGKFHASGRWLDFVDRW